jgi:hypothetical protein
MSLSSVAGQAGVMHRHDGARVRRDRGLDGGDGDRHPLGLDVDEHRLRAQVAHHFRGGGEGQGGNDDLVAGADADALQRKMQPGRGRIDRDRLQAAVAEIGLEVELELARHRAGRDPAGTQTGDDGLDLGLVDVGQCERQESVDGGV